MQEKMVTVPELAMIAGTRAALGAGVGLLLADHLKTDERRAAGWTLLAVGILSTIPLAAEVIFRRHHSNGRLQTQPADDLRDRTPSAEL